VLPRDNTLSFGTCNESDKDPTPPEVRFTCARASPSPSPDLLGRQAPQAGPGPETIMRDDSVVDDTNAAPESSGDQARNQRDVGTTIQSVQISRPSVEEVDLDNDEGGRLANGSQASTFSRLRPRPRLATQSKVTQASTRSLRPRPNAEPTQPEHLSAVSVVIPTRRTDELVASTKTNPPTRARRYRDWGNSDCSNLNSDRTTLAVTGNYPPSSGGSSPEARGRSRKSLKRAIENTSTSTNDIVGKCTGQPQTPLASGLAVTLGETQEIFGRGILRIQTHGPRHAYFMTFLPEISHQPSMILTSKMPPDQSLRTDDFSENTSSQQVPCKRRRKRTVSITYDDEDVWTTRHSAKSARNSRSRTDPNNARRKPRRRLRWSSEGVDLLLKLRRDEQRPWSEVTRLFLDRYPGRSPGAIQVYWSTYGRQKSISE
jgi:hypothetical protein